MAAALAVAAIAAATQAAAATVSSAPYGRLRDGREVTQLTLRNRGGVEVRLIGYGAIVTDIIVPDRAGRRANIVLGFATLADYEAKNGQYGFGAVIGRYAGRIANARFAIDGREVRLVANDGPNTLHGGPGGLDTRLWTMVPFAGKGRSGAVLRYVSPAGEQGFPGRLDIAVTYTLTDEDELRVAYRATTDAPTMLNLTNHSYFNLAGAGSGTIRNQRLRIAARRLVETRSSGIPTGRLVSVAGTPFDFRKARPIGAMLDRAHPQLEGRGGFNHTWLLDRGSAARLFDPVSGRRLDVVTSAPALHVYAANWFSGRDQGAQGSSYRAHDGIALETQGLPDAPNQPGFPSALLRPGETFRSTTSFRFSVAGR